MKNKIKRVFRIHTDNIILIGMPAVGKSTIGVILAKILGYQFIDSDIVIQETEQKLLKDIIAAEGVDGFIEVENRVNASLDATRAIIATGGSAVYGREAMQHLKELGTILYLKVDYDVLSNRLTNVKNRGVVLREGQTIRDIYEERTALYETYADITVDVSHAGVEDTIEMICRELNLY